MMYAGLLASALLCWRLLIGAPLRHPRLVGRCTAAGLALLLFCFCLFSYRVPGSRLWMDRPCQSFGIIERHILFNRHLTTQCPTRQPCRPCPDSAALCRWCWSAACW